jgi:hypothetical protein
MRSYFNTGIVFLPSWFEPAAPAVFQYGAAIAIFVQRHKTNTGVFNVLSNSITREYRY